MSSGFLHSSVAISFRSYAMQELNAQAAYITSATSGYWVEVVFTINPQLYVPLQITISDLLRHFVEDACKEFSEAKIELVGCSTTQRWGGGSGFREIRDQSGSVVSLVAPQSTHIYEVSARFWLSPRPSYSTVKVSPPEPTILAFRHKKRRVITLIPDEKNES